MAVAPVGALSDYQSVSVTTASTTFTTGAKPAGMALQNGDLLLCVVAWTESESDLAPSVPAGGAGSWSTALGYTEDAGSQGVGVGVFYKVVADAATEQAATYSVTVPVAARGSIAVRAYRGVHTTSPLDVSAASRSDAAWTTQAAPIPYPTPALTTGTAGAWVSSGCVLNSSSTTSVALTKPATTQVWDLAGRRSLMVEDGAQASAGAVPVVQWTNTGVGSIQAVTWRVALRPADGGGGGGFAGSLTNRVVGVDGRVKARVSSGVTSARLAVSATADMSSPRYTAAVTPNAQGDVILDTKTITSPALTAGTRYYYRVEMTDAGGTALDSASSIGRVKIAPTGPVTFTYSFSSCMNETDGVAMARIAAADPDLFVMTGDLFYNDGASTTVAQYRTEYATKQNGANHAAAYHKIPMTYTASDHDYGIEDGSYGNVPSGSRAGFNQVYREMWPTAPDATAGTEGVWHTWTWGRVRFVVLDTRTWMSNPANTDDANKTMLGATQKAWFKDLLTNHDEPLWCVFVDAPWVSRAYAGDDLWGSFTTERAELAAHATGLGRELIVHAGDMHALAYWPKGTTDYGGQTVNPGGFASFQAAPLFNNSSVKGGGLGGGSDGDKITGWSPGGLYYGASISSQIRCFGLVSVTDNGVDPISVTFNGYSTDGSTDTQRLTYTTTYAAPPAEPPTSGSTTVGAVTSTTISPLTVGAQYDVTVTAFNSSGDAPPSDPVRFTAT